MRNKNDKVVIEESQETDQSVDEKTEKDKDATIETAEIVRNNN